MSTDVEFAVVGGGLAGSTLAARLARAGRQVLLIERGGFPRDKLCGEFLSHESQAILRSLDVLDQIERDSPPRIGRARFVGASGRTVRIRLPEPALGVSRKRLDTVLFDAAQAAGAQAWTRSEVVTLEALEGGGHRVDVRRGDAPAAVTAKTVVCAHGRRGRPDHALDRAFVSIKHPFAGLKRHHRPAEDAGGEELASALTDHVEIYPFEGGYCGMSFIETGEVNVCLLAHEDVLKKHESPGDTPWDRVRALMVAAHPPLAERLASLVPTDPDALAVAAVPFTPKAAFEGGVFFVGDAAGMIAPLAGDGQAMALDGADRLADLLLSGPVQADTGRVWARTWRKTYGLRMALAGRLQRMLLRPRTAEIALSVVGSVPGLPDLLGRLTRG